MKFGSLSVSAAAFLIALSTGSASQAAVDKSLSVNVYQLCDDDGSSCASLGPTGNSFFAEQTNTIWAQAGISVSFNFVRQIHKTELYDINDADYVSSFQRLSGGPKFDIVNMFLVHSINGGAAYGEAWEGAGGLVIAMDAVMSYSASGRVDTIAHELGHNLGLVSDADGGFEGHSADPFDLMSSGAFRFIPSSSANIAPNGSGFDYLPQYQVNVARGSGLLVALAPVPEPGEWAMMLLGLGVTGAVARRKRVAA